MKHKLTVIIIVFLFVLTGCSRENNNTSPTPTPAPGGGEEVILIWWNLFEPEENVRPLIDAYEVLHPNVTIQYEQKGVSNGVDGYRQDLDVAVSDGNPLTTPDIFIIHNTWAGRFEQYITKAPAATFSQQDLTDFYTVVSDDFYRGGALEAVPIYMDALSVIYNKNKLIQGGYTVPSDDWSEFQVQARKLSQKNSGGRITTGGFSAFYPENTEFSFDVMNLLLLQNGVEMLNNNGEAIFASQDEALDALNFYRSFVTSNSSTWDVNMKKDIAAFLENKLTMYIAPSWRLIDILNYNEAYDLNLDIGVASLPQLAGTDEIYWSTYWGMTVSKDTPRSDVAWDFLKFITQAEQLRLLNQTVKQNGRPIGIIYPRISMAGDISVDQYLGPYVQALNKAQTWDMYDGYLFKEKYDSTLTTSSNLDLLQNELNNIINQ